MVFEKVQGQSIVWDKFTFDTVTEKAKCNICESILLAKGKSTSGLKRHLTGKHKLQLTEKPDLPAEPKKRKLTTTPLTPFLTGKKSLDEVIARLASEDLLTLRVIAKSEGLRKAFKADGYELPQSPTTVQACVLRFYESVKAKMVSEIAGKIEKGLRLSLSTDEYTSTRNRRYLNINLHYPGGFYCLGLVRVHGSMPADVMVESVKKRLEDFEVDPKHILAAITDGAKIMECFAGKMEWEHVICVAHTIQKAVEDVLYPEKKKVEKKVGATENEELSDDEEDGGLEIDFEEELLELLPHYDELIKEIQSLCRMFRKSPVKNDDFLQANVIKEFNKELKLILDSKTRWYSLHDMVKRFLKLVKAIKRALLDMEKEFNFSPDDLKDLEDLCQALEPLKASSMALCSRDATLWSAEKTLEFTLTELESQTSDIAGKIYDALKERIKQRRNPSLIHLVEYLNDPKFAQKGRDQYGSKVTKKELHAKVSKTIFKLYSIKDDSDDEEEQRDSSTLFAGNENLSYTERLKIHLQ